MPPFSSFSRLFWLFGVPWDSIGCTLALKAPLCTFGSAEAQRSPSHPLHNHGGLRFTGPHLASCWLFLLPGRPCLPQLNGERFLLRRTPNSGPSPGLFSEPLMWTLAPSLLLEGWAQPSLWAFALVSPLPGTFFLHGPSEHSHHLWFFARRLPKRPMTD